MKRVFKEFKYEIIEIYSCMIHKFYIIIEIKIEIVILKNVFGKIYFCINYI